MSKVVKFETLEELALDHLNYAKKCYEKNCEYISTVIGYSGSKRVMLTMPYRDDQEKLFFANVARILFVAYAITRYTFGCESFTLEKDAKSMDDLTLQKLKTGKIRPSEHPDAFEALMVISASKNARRVSGYKIEDGRIAGEALNSCNNEAKVSGLFAELLPPDKVRSNGTIRADARMILKKLGILVKVVDIAEPFPIS